MNTIDRRSLFALTAAAAGHRLLPDWLAQALAIQEPVSTWRAKQLREATGRAQKAEKPLLVLIAPAKNDGDLRGMWFGAWLNELADDSMWVLASCELACATTEELGTLLGRPVAGSPMWVLVDAGSIGKVGAAARVTAIECALSALPQASGRRVSGRSNDQPRVEARQAGLLAMCEALQNGVARHGLDLASLSAAAMHRLDNLQKEELDAWFAGGKRPGSALVALAAPEIWRRIGASPESERKAATAVLRSAIRECVISAPVAGARWMGDVSCINREFENLTRAEKKAKEKAEDDARRVEEELAKDLTKFPTPEQIAVLGAVGISACGIGYVPPLCERFLEFWTAGD